MAATVAASLGTSSVRNSSRQTRTNPTRTSKTIGATLRQNSLISNPPAPAIAVNEPPGFYPAIAHFTDSIAALPRDYRRHTSLLKEVDAKAWEPEENVQVLLARCLEDGAPQPTIPGADLAAPAGEISVGANQRAQDNASVHSYQSTNPAVNERRELFSSLRHNLMVMMVTMDEKNHVINNANEELSRHLTRLHCSYPAIADEVSEEARLGSLKHWAYFETNPMRKTAQGARREAAASLATMHDTEIAQRSESRREAMLAKKQRQNNVDSDFDDNRVTGKRVQNNGKNRRVGELAAENAGLGVSSATTQKRKKVDKPAAGGAGMERSISSVFGGRPMSREPSQQENKKRKASVATTTTARKRLNANESPKLASSPLMGTFGKDARKGSPAPSFARPASSRARQNSAQTLDGAHARPSSSTARKNTAHGNGVAASTPDTDNVAATTSKSAAEAKSSMKETTTGKGDKSREDDGGEANGVRGSVLPQRSASKQASLKREPNTGEENGSRAAASPRLPAAIMTESSRGERAGRGRISKTSTPVVGSFAESADDLGNGASDNGHGHKQKRVSRPRTKDQGLYDSLSPKGLPVKRSHKKGAGIVAQQQHAQRLARQAEANPTPHLTSTTTTTTTTTSSTAAADDAPEPDNGSDSGEDFDEEEDADADATDEKYCYCNDVSYGEMVGCDNRHCSREWFHLACVALEKAPPKNQKWYCDECLDLMKRGKHGTGNGNGNGNGGAK